MIIELGADGRPLYVMNPRFGMTTVDFIHSDLETKAYACVQRLRRHSLSRIQQIQARNNERTHIDIATIARGGEQIPYCFHAYADDDAIHLGFMPLYFSSSLPFEMGSKDAHSGLQRIYYGLQKTYVSYTGIDTPHCEIGITRFGPGNVDSYIGNPSTLQFNPSCGVKRNNGRVTLVHEMPTWDDITMYAFMPPVSPVPTMGIQCPTRPDMENLNGLFGYLHSSSPREIGATGFCDDPLLFYLDKLGIQFVEGVQKQHH